MAKSYKVTVFAGTKVVADMAQQVKNATIDASLELKPIAGGATEATAVLLPVPNPLPMNSNRKRTKAIGWYKNATGPAWEAPKEYDNTNWWSFETGLWSLGSSIPMIEPIPDGKVAAGESKAVNGNEVYKKSLTKEIYVDGNDFDPSARITNSYINNNTGLISNTGEEKYVISIIYPCVEGDNIYFSNWDRNSSFCVRFLNNSNAPLKPLKSDGTQFSIYSDTFIGPIKAPVGAVGYQYTLIFNNYGNQANLIVNKTGVTKESIKNKFINANAKVVESDTNPLSGDTAAKQLIKKDYLIVGANWYDYTKDIEKFYINTTTGLLAAEDKSAISPILDVNAVGKVIVQNRLGNGAYRFLSAGNVPMKALDKDGVEFSSFAGPLNGEFYKPVGAVGFQFTSKFIDATNRTNTVVNQDGYLTPQVKKELIPVDTNGKMWISKTGNNVSVNGINSNGAIITTNLTFRSGANTQSNPNFNLVSDYISNIYFKGSGDDVAPVNLFSETYIGANHGWRFARTITLNGHGKTVSDIGSVYYDSLNRDVVILNVPDNNNLVVCIRNQATDGYSYYFPALSGTLTYKNNGANTGTLTGYSQTAIDNLYNLVKLNVSKIVLDGNDVSGDGNYYGTTIQVVEDYDVFDLDSVLDKLIAGRPTGGYLAPPNLNSFNAIKLFNHSLIYEWKKPGKCLISHSFLAYKKLAFNFHGFVQATALANSSAKIYIPKALPFGGVDYRLAPTYNAPAAPVHITKASYWEYPTNAPDRVMNFIVGNYGIHLGYIKDLGDSINRESLVDDAIFLQNTSKKLYPKGIDKVQVLEAGANYSIVAFRNIIDLTNVGTVRTSLDFTRADNALYVTVDYHKQGLDIIEIPDDFLGRNIVILESRKADLYGKISSKLMKINSSADDYGFIKFKIK